MTRGKIFENDFQEVQELFPKLKAKWNPENLSWYINGTLDICDTKGEYWCSFDLAIFVPKSYPYCLPIVKEVSKHIKRGDEWHINHDGICCLDIDHKMLFLAIRGINILDFIRDYVYPYFANQYYKVKTEEYAGGEYQHHFEGIQQFYSEDLNIHDPVTATLILDAILNGTIPGRNEKCICQKTKFKKCHLNAVEYLGRIPHERLNLDLEEFRKIINANQSVPSHIS